MRSQPQKPTHRLLAMTRQGVEPHREGVIGVGWARPDGSISIRLEGFSVISAADNLVITLFPAIESTEEKKPA